jgi:hypothetical protein
MKKKNYAKKIYIAAALCIITAASFVFASCKDGPVFNDPNPSGLAAPVINSIEPASGLLNDTVTITGSGFNTNTDYNFVSFTNDVGTVVSASATELKVKLPGIVNTAVKAKVAVKGSLYWSNGVDFQFNDTTTVTP